MTGEGVWAMTDTEFNESLREAKEAAWDEGLQVGMDWMIPKGPNPYRSGK